MVFGEHNKQTAIDCTANYTYCADPVVAVQTETPVVHPGYNPASNNHIHDIAIIPLKTRVTYTNYIRPICLLRQPSNQKTMWISGWGRTETGRLFNCFFFTKKKEIKSNFSDVSSEVKLRGTVLHVNNADCQKAYDRVNVNLTDTQICAGDEGKDTCRGDSGGPLMVKDLDDVWYAEGIVSFGYVCGRKEWPGVYTHLPRYTTWIDNVLMKDKRI